MVAYSDFGKKSPSAKGDKKTEKDKVAYYGI